ncbi:MAG: hypothetical protein SX243_21210 [Acidobacteriota bacterium]|nr:hypothetical protein [Acidobacteriota bacterium]
MSPQVSTLRLNLSPQLEGRLTSEARKLGLSLEEYALRLLEEPSARVQRPRTGAEVVAYWRREEVLGSRRDITDAAAHAAELRNTNDHRNSAQQTAKD